MKIVLAGCTGFIGRRLVQQLVERGHDCTVLIRSSASSGPGIFPETVRLAPYKDMPDEAEAVVNLAGESVAGLWTTNKKVRILRSRVETTEKLVKWMEGLSKRPSIFVSGSATGIYGDRGDERLSEKSNPDPENRFLAQVCKPWEAAANKAREFGVRVVTLRTGNVLDPAGGMIGKMLPMFRISPFVVPFAKDAYLPWISMRDEIGCICYSIENDWVEGPVNLVSPTQSTFGELQAALAEKLNRPVIGSIPNWALRLVTGEFSEALLASQRVLPEKMQNAGYVFEDPDLGEYLKGLNL